MVNGMGHGRNPESWLPHPGARFEETEVDALLQNVLNAHGGIDRWRSLKRVDATIVSGGGFFGLKGIIQDTDPRRVTAWLHEERMSLQPYGAPDQRSVFTADRVAVERLDGSILAERRAPKDFFAGHQMNTPWDPLHRAYFNGEALWTYLATPFLLAMQGVTVEEIEPWQEGGERWRVLRARFPGSIETHSATQDFFFDESLMLRRHDYQVNIAGGFAAAQLTSEHVRRDGIALPTRRRAYTRGPDGRPNLDMLMVWIDLSDISYS
jgi:hypothetical protein